MVKLSRKYKKKKIVLYCYTLFKNVKSGNNSYRSKYTYSLFLLKYILILLSLKIHVTIFLLIFIQIKKSAVEIRFSLFSDKNFTFFSRILELRIEKNIFDIPKEKVKYFWYKIISILNILFFYWFIWFFIHILNWTIFSDIMWIRNCFDA